MTTEIQTKLNRLGEFLDRHQLDGVLLNHRANFAWITGGKDNYIPGNSQNGVASILATRNERICVTTSIEAPRYATEELAGTGIRVEGYPWYDAAAAKAKLKELIAGRRIAADVSDSGDWDHYGAGLVKLPGDFVQLRWQLTPAEIERYKEGGRRTAAAIERAARAMRYNSSEFEIAGILDYEIWQAGLVPVVTLVAADQRVEQYRHPIATNTRVQRYAMLVSCASLGGLISNVTRFASFVPLSDDLKRKQQAVANVDAAVNLQTRPGKTLGDMFKIIEKAYADNGFPGEYANHHQGGSTGYAGREAFANPTNSLRVLENQAYAWNPSIAGVKSEDTMLVTSGGIEMITAPGAEWPKVKGHCAAGDLDRADILVR